MTIQEDIVFSLEGKITQVIGLAERLKTSNMQLQEQVDKLTGELRVRNQEIEVLESKYQSLKLVKTLISSPEDVKNARFQVNRLVREIDKCIALLNR